MAAIDRRLEQDLWSLRTRLVEDDEFAVEVYCALCNSTWTHEDGSDWSGSWRYSAGLIAEVRGVGESYMDFYCSGIPTQAEGTISDRVAEAMAELGWSGVGEGSDKLYLIDFRTGETTVLGEATGQEAEPSND